jgi:ribose-phosphate pyrophosphokinase
MVTLDLTSLENSNIKYTISKFPDGQQSITLDKPAITQRLSMVLIKSRLNSFRDLELIITANQCLREFGIEDINLYTPYFLGGRSDRKFGEGQTNYLKNVICPIINSQKFNKVVVMDPHSDVLEACLDNFVKIGNIDLVEFALDTINDRNVTLVSPDAGAFKKIYDVATHFGIEKIITATKVRDMKTGNILYTDVPGIDQHNKVKYVIVDDICDGGRTFIEIAKTIHNIRPTAEIYLVVTHGIFSAGYGELNKYFSGIFTTNSIKDIGTLEADSYGKLNPTGITQLNVFINKLK